MSIKNEMTNDFKNSMGDYAHAAVGGAIASIPGIGNLASEIFHTIISSPLEKKKRTMDDKNCRRTGRITK